MAKLHIEGSKLRPEIIKHYLDFIDRRTYDSFDAVMDDIYRETGIDIVDTKNMTTTLSKLGVVNDEDRQQLTDHGRALVDILLTNEQLFYELFHLTYATAYHRNPTPNRAISWAYYHISEDLRHRAPTNYDDAKQEVAEAVMATADKATDPALDDPGPLSKNSLNNYRRFIKKLDPPVYDTATDEFTLREFVPTEPVLAAIDHLYRTDVVSDTIGYGDLLELSKGSAAAEALCTILLVQEEKLIDIIEHVASMDARLTVKSDYQLRVRLSEEVNFNDLA